VQGNHFLHSKLLNPAHKNRKNGSALRGYSKDMTQPSGADYLNTISQVQNGGNKNETINSYDETVNNNGVTNVSQVNNSFIMSESYM